jgi:cation diffusion facilitator family transporter
MHTKSLEPWSHDHAFGQDIKTAGESRTLVVIVITLLTMVVEIIAGIAFGSMALLADGFHMASHASALTISAFAYYYTRRHAHDQRFNFGTGKVNSLAGFASAVILAIFALVMVWESVERFIKPVEIGFNQAILVAILGLIVNGVCLVILGGHGHSHDQANHSHEQCNHDHHKDHNLWSAYIHVLADALTSLLAIFALLAGKYLGLNWLDPCMGIVGAILVTRWSWGLLRASSHILLDMQAPKEYREKIKEVIESVDDNRISDLHVWSVGTGIYAVKMVIISSSPLTIEEYHNLIPEDFGLVHKVIEIRKCNVGKD